MDETKPVAQGWDSAKKNKGKAENQVYMDMSKPHGQDANAAMNDMFVAMMTPGGLLKKTLDSTYPTPDAVKQNIANLSSSDSEDDNDNNS